MASLTNMRGRSIFLNLVLGRLGEDFFRRWLRARAPGLALRTYVDTVGRKYAMQDFGVLRNGSEICHLNVKVHASLFRNAKKFVGLEPSNCFAIGVYKILTAYRDEESSQIPFFFTVFIKWSIRDHVDQILQTHLTQQLVGEVVGTFGRARRQRSEEDDVLDKVVSLLQGRNLWGGLLHELEISESKVISSTKAFRLLLQNIDKRCPMLRLGGASAKFGGEIDMHLSIRDEMADLGDFVRILHDCESPKDARKRTEGI